MNSRIAKILGSFRATTPNSYIWDTRLRDLLQYYTKKPSQPHTATNAARIEVNTSELGQFVWRRLLPLVGTTPFPPHELLLMGAAMLWVRPRLVVEWGTNVGVSARIFRELNAHYGIGAEIHSIDLPRSAQHREHPGERRGLLVRGSNVHLHEGDGATLAAQVISSTKCARPLVFIDGDHAQESVLRDARSVLSVAPRACLLFHDTFYQPAASYNHGPYEAIQYIVNEIPGACQIVEAGLGCPGMTLVVPA